MLSDFHFLDPWWLLALAPLALLLWWSQRRNADGNAWRRVIDERLLQVLTIQPESLHGLAARLPLALLALGWLIAVLALANPTVERKPAPTFSGGVSRVVVLDLSRSMLAADLTPTRLARARYKVADILARVKDGRVGLVAFAGDAFTVAPLTDDTATIAAMLEALQPEIMPVAGSRPDLAIEQAANLLSQAGATHGEVVLITDDAGDHRARAAAESLRAAGHRLEVIGVGSADGAPVPGVRAADGPVMTKLDTNALHELARAGGGAYANLTADDRDLAAVLQPDSAGLELPAVLTDNQAQAWYPLGPWIALALLPLGALAFRRGWLITLAPLLVMSMVSMTPQPALALGWDDLWLRRDQQAAEAMAAQDHERARALATNPQQRGTAAYRAGDFASAAADFAAGDTATDHYNRGNALARSGSLKDALTAYEQTLSLEPRHLDAQHNHEQVEALLKQEQQQQQQGEQSEQQDGDQSQDQSQRDRSNQNQGDQNQNQRDQQNQQGQQSSSENQQGQDQSQDSASQDSEQSQNNQNAADGQQQNQQQQDRSDQRSPRQAGAQEQNPTGGEDGLEAGRDETAEQQAADAYRSAAEAAQAAKPEDDGLQPAAADAEMSEQDREARAAADQWLRRIPDDPAGLLRRKFLYQYSQRANPEHRATAGNPW